AVVDPGLAGVGRVPEFEAFLIDEACAVDGKFDEALGGVAFVGRDGRRFLAEGDPGERKDSRCGPESPRERHKFLFTDGNALRRILRPWGRTAPPLRVHCG